MANILITGASGFVGKHLCRYLEGEGYQLRKCFRTPPLDMSEDDVAIGNIDGLTDWSEALDGIDTVIHLAGKAHNIRDKAHAVSSFRSVNYEGTQRLATEAASYGVKRLIFLSSIAVYESGITKITDLTKPHPGTPYGISKLQAEMAIQDICERSSMDYSILRPPLVYGPHAPGNIAKLKKIVSLGLPLPFAAIKNKRSLISVKNLSSIIHACIEDNSACNEVFLVSDTVDLSTCDLMKMFASDMRRTCFLFYFPERWLILFFKITGLFDSFHKAFGSLVLDTNRTYKVLNWSPIERSFGSKNSDGE